MKILAVDFDGVISDSALKSLFVSHNAYCKYFGSQVKKNFGGELFTFDNWEDMKKQYKKEMDYYRRLRSYLKLSGDFFLIIKIVEEQIQIKDQQEFNSYRNQLKFDYQFFLELFFQEKEKWQKKSFRKWFFLSPVFQEIVKGIQRFTKEGQKIVIATSNLGKAIHRAFQPEYLGFEIDIEDIFDKNFGKHKAEHMQAIAKKYGAELNEIYFVDDQLSYLEGTNALGVNVFLAGWGYCTESQKEEAKKEKITVIEEEKDFYPVLKKALS
ncbi:MAG: HAD family hydrolase [Candidatus Caldatribacteriota bacterium]|nr:HAD family hydrolase [Candidatus Caldatribacteriota bacterium]